MFILFCASGYPGVKEPQFGKLRCSGIKKMDWKKKKKKDGLESSGVQHDLEGLECHLGIWAFCWTVETSGDHVM